MPEWNLGSELAFAMSARFLEMQDGSGKQKVGVEISGPSWSYYGPTKKKMCGEGGDFSR